MTASTLEFPAPIHPEQKERPIARLARGVGAAWAANPPLALVGVGTLALVIPFVVGILVDPRVITGAPAWLKPTKFAVSIGVYSLTLIWFLSFVRGHSRLVSAIGWGTAVAFLLEIAVIGGQAARGTTSHFNDATPLDGALYSIMGASIVVVWVLGLAAAILLLRQRVEPRSLALAIRFGLIGALIGMAVAIPMVAALEAHAVGVADGGPGLPVVGWSTEGGDLRVGHFVGLHAMQALPLLAWGLARLAPGRLSERRRTALVSIAGVTWIGLTLLLTWQALRAQPVIAPDTATLAALGALLGATAIATFAVVITARLGQG